MPQFSAIGTSPYILHLPFHVVNPTITVLFQVCPALELFEFQPQVADLSSSELDFDPATSLACKALRINW